MDETIRRTADLEKQRLESYRYWQSRPISERLAATWKLSAAAYGLTGAEEHCIDKTMVRIIPSKSSDN